MQHATRTQVFVDGAPVDAIITARQDFEMVYSYSPELDPAWTFTDAAGHFHAVAESGDRTPTLRWVVDEPGYMDADGEEYPERGHEECVICGEHIRVGTRHPSPFGTRIPGPKHWDMTLSGGTELLALRDRSQVSVHTDTEFGVMWWSGLSVADNIVTAEYNGWLATRADS